MLIYYSVLIIAGLAAYVYSNSRKGTASAFWFALVFFALTIPAAIRYGIGTDYLPIYVPKLVKVLGGEYDDSEYGYYLLEKIVLDLTESGAVFFAVAAALKYMLVLKAFPRRRFFFGTIWYVLMWYTASYNAERQSIAVGFVLVALSYLLARRFKTSLVVCLLGCCFHYSAALAVLIGGAAFVLCRLSKIKIICLMIFALALTQVSGFLNRLLVYVPHDTRYGDYVTDASLGQSMAMGSGLGHWGLILLILSIGFVLISCAKRRNARMLGILCVFAATMRLMGAHMYILERFTYISDLAIPFALFELWRVKSFAYGRHLAFSFFALAFLLFIKGLIPMNGTCLHDVVPYRTIFSESVNDILDGEKPPR